MADDKSSTSQKIVHVTAPESKAIVHGITVQSDINAATEVAEVELLKGIQEKIKTQKAAEKRFQEEFRKAVDARDKAVEELTVPKDLPADLEKVAKALLVFHKGAAVTDPADVDVHVDFGRKQISATMGVYDGRPGNTVFNAIRTWPMPDDLIALDAAVKAVQEKQTTVKRNLERLALELQQIPQRTKELRAAIIRQGLSTDETGKKTLEAMSQVTAARLDIIEDDLEELPDDGAKTGAINVTPGAKTNKR